MVPVQMQGDSQALPYLPVPASQPRAIPPQRFQPPQGSSLMANPFQQSKQMLSKKSQIETRYRGFSFSKPSARDKDWSRAIRREEKLSQSDLARVCATSQDRHGNSTGVDNYLSLTTHKKQLVDGVLQLVDEEESDLDAEWNIEHLQLERKKGDKSASATSIHVIVCRRGRGAIAKPISRLVKDEKNSNKATSGRIKQRSRSLGPGEDLIDLSAPATTTHVNKNNKGKVNTKPPIIDDIDGSDTYDIRMDNQLTQSQLRAALQATRSVPMPTTNPRQHPPPPPTTLPQRQQQQQPPFSFAAPQPTAQYTPFGPADQPRVQHAPGPQFSAQHASMQAPQATQPPAPPVAFREPDHLSRPPLHHFATSPPMQPPFSQNNAEFPSQPRPLGSPFTHPPTQPYTAQPPFPRAQPSHRPPPPPVHTSFPRQPPSNHQAFPPSPSHTRSSHHSFTPPHSPPQIFPQSPVSPAFPSFRPRPKPHHRPATPASIPPINDDYSSDSDSASDPSVFFSDISSVATGCTCSGASSRHAPSCPTRHPPSAAAEPSAPRYRPAGPGRRHTTASSGGGTGGGGGGSVVADLIEEERRAVVRENRRREREEDERVVREVVREAYAAGRRDGAGR